MNQFLITTAAIIGIVAGLFSLIEGMAEAPEHLHKILEWLSRYFAG